MKNVFKIMVGILAGVLVVGLAWLVRTDTHFFQVEETPTQLNFPADHLGLGPLLRKPIKRAIDKISSKNIWSVDLKALQKELVSNIWVKQVRLRRQLPNTVALSLDIEEVAFNWQHKGKLYPVTIDGSVLDVPEAASYFPDRPILNHGDVEMEPSKFQQWVQLVHEIPDAGLLKKDNISSIRFLQNEGLTLKFLDNKTTVHLGWENISTKGLQILKVQEYLESQKQKARVIDGSFNKKVLVRLRKRS